MKIKHTRYGCHIIHGYNVDVCITSKDIQVMFMNDMITVYSGKQAIVTVHNVDIKTVESDFTIEA